MSASGQPSAERCRPAREEGDVGISVTGAADRAVARTRVVLLRPFSLGKWLVLGFCTFLAQLGEGTGFSFNYRQWGRRGPGQLPIRQIRDWIMANSLLLLVGVLCILLIGLAIAVLVGTCLTCCIAGLPYIQSVVFLPVYVFFRCFSVCFLEQFGEDWRLIKGDEPAPPHLVDEVDEAAGM